MTPIDWFPRTFSVEQLAMLDGVCPDFTFGARPLQKRLLIRVTPQDGESWTAAALGDEIGGIQQALVSTPSPDHLVVVFGGLGYWVPTKDPSRWEELGAIPVVGVTKASRDLLLVSDFTEIYGLGRDGLLWRAGGVSLDGFEILSIDSTRHCLLGKGFNPHVAGEGFFTVSLVTRAVTLLKDGCERPDGGSPPMYAL